MPSYRVVSTLPVPAVLRAAQSAQDGGYERLEEQAEDDDQDESQCIFHNLELISFPYCPSPLPGRSGLTHRWASLDLQERIYANTRGRMNGLTASCQKKKDAASGDTTIL